MTYTEASFLLTMVKRTVEEHGCKLIDIDLDNQVIHLEGPEKNKTECALVIADILK
jgi:hypothetical protein